MTTRLIPVLRTTADIMTVIAIAIFLVRILNFVTGTFQPVVGSPTFQTLLVAALAFVVANRKVRQTLA